MRFFQQLSDEWNIVSRLSSPHLVQYLDYDEFERCLDMEYCNDGSLLQRAEEQVLTEQEAAQFTAQILIGLKVLHDQGLNHGDLKAALAQPGSPCDTWQATR